MCVFIKFCIVPIVTQTRSLRLHFCHHNGVFTLPDTDTDTDKKWVIKNCVKVFILPDRDTDTDTDTDTDEIGLQTHFVGVGVGVDIDVDVRQCEHTINTMLWLALTLIQTQTLRVNKAVLSDCDIGSSILSVEVQKSAKHPLNATLIMEVPMAQYEGMLKPRSQITSVFAFSFDLLPSNENVTYERHHLLT